MGCFRGTDEAIEQITQLFKSIAEQEQKDCGQLPNFIWGHARRFGYHNISQDNESTGVIQYETKWSPNTEAVKQIAQHFKVDFTDYEELGCSVYGGAIFENGILTDICLDTQDFDSFEFDRKQIPTILRVRNMTASGKYSKRCRA